MGGCGEQIAPPALRDGPPTIVSLNPCADAILAEVAAPGQLLAISHYSQQAGSSSMDLDTARQYRAVSGSAEEVIALAPDLVVADSFLAPDTRAALEAAGLRLENVGMASTLGESVGEVRELAGMIGQTREGERLAGKIEAAWAAAEHRGAPLDALFWQAGGIVPGEHTLAAAMLKHTGFSLHSAARGLGQGAYIPLEDVLADPPQVVIAASDEPMLTHPVLRATPGLAYRQFDASLLYCGGPTIVRALERLRAIRESMP